MTIGFEKLASKLYKLPKILDVGGGGLGGHNTTNALQYHLGYANVTCVQVKEDVAREYVKKFPGTNMMEQDFYEHEFKEKFDCIVLDLNIDNNILKDWEGDTLEKVSEMLNPNGIVILYVVTMDSSSPNDPHHDYLGKLIDKHINDFWGGYPTPGRIYDLVEEKFPKYQVKYIEKDEEREYITWVALQKK